MPLSEFQSSLQGCSYDAAVASETSAPIQTTPSQPSVANPETPTATADRVASLDRQDVPDQKHPQTLSDTASSTHDRQINFSADDHAYSNSPSAPGIPMIFVDNHAAPQMPTAGNKEEDWPLNNLSVPGTSPQEQGLTNTKRSSFQGIALDLPAGKWGDTFHTNNMKFSNRGSMFIDGRKVNTADPASSTLLQRPTMGTKRIPTSSSVPDRLPPRAMSTDEEALSEKVRSYYAHGSDAVPETSSQAEVASKMGRRWQNTLGVDAESIASVSRPTSTIDPAAPHSPTTPTKESSIPREDLELAGGLEDWQDVDNADVDRYGFIVPRSPTSPKHTSGVQRSGTVNGQGIQRVSTSLQLASETPRRRRTIRSSGNSVKGDARSASDAPPRPSSNHSIPRPSSSKSAKSQRYHTLRAASNRLPGNRDRRLMDEAGDMFTLPPSLTTGPVTRTATMESDQSIKSRANLETKATSAAARKKELEREEKWRKMARAMPSTSPSVDHKGIGGGMLFSFPPPTDAKLVSRTWKGIPDTWRAPAWHYFLSMSARRNPQSLPDDKIIQLFYEYQESNSPDDVQIDIDVPRTISSHIMFRRRYRGGQRLLFRVLHAMSLHWPETGYVQGMAALAATLLSYYEEEKAFVMLVRLWECRGLGKLYKEGFGGLMEALNDFEKGWLGEGEVAKKLTDLNIFPTAYGTRWYLTLFNYSIPFAAQLRVWDVFMLLGDNETAMAGPSTAHDAATPAGAAVDSKTNAEDAPFGTTLDILHATSAALIDGMRDIILDSDFENAMKVLTSWIPIRDEDLFMRVARAEWKMHKEKQKRK